MNDTEIAEILNATFSGLTLFFRDTSLPQHLISRYQVGQILKEKGFTDMSYKGGGLATNFRYLIASANAKDLSMFSPESKHFGHVLLPANTFFKVVDIYTLGDKTQVFLLEIPANAIDFFGNATSTIEEDIIQKARENFTTKINMPPVAELQVKEWKERTGFPIGMNSSGDFFYPTYN